MLFLIALIIAVFIAFVLDKPLKKHPTVFYVTAAVLTAVSIIIMQSDIEISSRFVRDYVIGMFSRGALGGAFWAVVMWAGALPNGSAPIKKLMPIRGELSITAAILPSRTLSLTACSIFPISSMTEQARILRSQVLYVSLWF